MRSFRHRQREQIIQEARRRIPFASPTSGGAASQLDANGTTLDVNAIVDGEVLKRVGSTIVSAPAGAPGAHAATHQNGGGDEINVAGLSGLLADAQTPLAHDMITAHTTAGRTAGQVIRASSPTVFAWALLAFADLTATPTTLAGYGITDAYTKTQSDAQYAPIVHSHTFASLTSKPTTLAGYGITDAAAISHTHPASDIVSGQLALARGGTGLDGSAGNAINLVLASPGSGGAGALSLRALVAADIPALDAAKITTGTVATARLGSGAASATVHLRGDQTWAAVAFADLSGKPTTIAGYGITDFNSLGDARWAALTHDMITAHTTSGRTIGQVIRASGATTFAWATLAFADLSGIPTTVAGYGITDVYTKTAADARYAPIVHTHAAADITSGRFTAARLLDGTNGFYLQGKGSGVDPAYVSFITARLTADNTAIAAAVPTTVVTVANLVQAANANEEWDIEWILHIANSVAADVFVFNVTSSAGTLTGRYTVTGTNGVPDTGAGVEKRWSMAAGTITTATANAPGATGTIGKIVTVTIRAHVKLTVAGGNIQVGCRAGTNAAASSGTATVKTQSQMCATRIA